MHCVSCSIVMMAVIVAAPVALGQTRLQQEGYQPVEQLVDDTEMLRGSLRRVDAGLGSAGGQGTFVYRRSGRSAGREKLYFIAPGIVAEYDRSDYTLIEVDKDDFRIFQVAAPNTVFHIGLPEAERIHRPSPLTVALRADRPAPDAAQQEPAATRRDEAPWLAYRTFRYKQTESVLRTLDQLGQ